MWYARRQTQKNKTKAAPHLHLTSEQTILLNQLVSRIDNSKSNQTQSVRKQQSNLQNNSFMEQYNQNVTANNIADASGQL